MINLSLTDFVDISSKVGMSKITNLVKIKNRPPYSPAIDYYKQLRDHIIEIHKGDLNKNSFLPAKQLTHNEKKHLHYGNIINGYKKFWGNKELKWFDPPHEHWEENEISVTINPELGLFINGVPHVIKLYFKNDKLSKARSDISLFLLHQTLPKQKNYQDINYCILDIRNSRLISTNGFNKNILLALIGEASYISGVWSTIN